MVHPIYFGGKDDKDKEPKVSESEGVIGLTREPERGMQPEVSESEDVIGLTRVSGGGTSGTGGGAVSAGGGGMGMSIDSFVSSQSTGLLRLIMLIRSQNPCWSFIYNNPDHPAEVGDIVPTEVDYAGQGGGGGGGGAHNLLSVTHPDTSPALPSVVRGDLITGQGGVPTWARLAAGNVGDVLEMGVTDPNWVVPTIYDNVSVNGVACTNVDLDDATPAAPASSLNVKWQKDALAPNNVSAYLGYGAGLSVAGGVLVCTITQPDLVVVRNSTAVNVTIPTGYSAVIPAVFHIAGTVYLQLQGTSVMMIL